MSASAARKLHIDIKTHFTICLCLRRRGVLMVSALVQLRLEWCGFEPRPGTLCCILGQDTSLSQCLLGVVYCMQMMKRVLLCSRKTLKELISTEIPTHIPSHNPTVGYLRHFLFRKHDRCPIMSWGDERA